MKNFWEMRPAEEINAALNGLPVAQEHQLIRADDSENVKHYKLITVNGEEVDVPTEFYVLKQHKEAFRPVIEGLTLRGLREYQFMLWHTNAQANLSILVGDADDGVKFGFKVGNSFDRSSKISFGFKAFQKQQHVEIVEKEHVLVWGYRQVCSNGMVMKVPLKTTKYLDSVLVTKIKDLFEKCVSITHMGKDVDKKLEVMQYLTEGILLLKNPLNMMIVDAQHYPLTRDKAESFLKKYIGKRRMDKYLEYFDMEEQTLWGLYNSITFLASHQDEGLTVNVRENLLMKAADLLEKELMVQ